MNQLGSGRRPSWRWKSSTRFPGVILVLLFLGLTARPSMGQRFDPTMNHKRYFAGNLTTATKISGVAGNSHTTREPGNDAFLYGMAFDEVSDRPCYLKLFWWRHNVATVPGDWLFETVFNKCSGGHPGEDERLVIPGVSIVNLRAIHAVKVCSSAAANQRLKGATIYGSHIDKSDGSGVERDKALQQHFERPNCATQQPKRGCDPGKVAVGVIIEHNGDEIVGLSLKCARVIPRFVAQ